MKLDMFRRAAKLHGDQRGQGLVFAALSFLILVMSVGMVFNVGHVVSCRIAVQNAADSAALSAAMVEADCMSSIAWINNGMAQIYHSLLRQIADITTFAVLAEFEDPGGLVRSGEESEPPEGYPCPATVLWGTSLPYGAAPDAACTKLKELTDRAEVVFPEAKRWLMELSNIEQAIALAAPVMMDDEINSSIVAAGCTNKSVFFGSRWYPFDAGKVDVLIENLRDMEDWRLTVTESGEPTQVVEIAHPSDNVWHISVTTGVEMTDLTITRLDADGKEWEVVLTPPGDTITAKCMDVGGLDVWVVNIQPQGKPASTMEFKPFPDLDPKAYGFKTDQMTDWQIFRRNPGTGHLEAYNDGQWVDYTEETRMVNGYEVRVSMTNSIKVGEATVWLSVPPWVSFANTSIYLETPARLDHRAGRVTVNIANGTFKVGVTHPPIHELLSVPEADGRWRKHFDNSGDFWWRHRCTPLVPGSTWEYNYEELGALLSWENNRYRFALFHGVRWNYDTDYASVNGPTFDAALGDIDNPASSNFPPWMYWMGVAPASEDDDGLGMSFSAGSPDQKFWDAADAPDRTEYYQLRECWYCGGTGEVVDPDTGEPKTCPVCNGVRHPGAAKTHVCFRPIDTIHRGDKDGLDWKDFIQLMLQVDGSYGVDGRVREPLVLTDEFFKYGVNVAVWKDPWPGLRPEWNDPSGSTMTPILFKPLDPGSKDKEAPEMPNWGVMAVSSARAGFNDQDYGGIGWTFKLAGGAEGESSDRLSWVDGDTSLGNLYITEWTAKLVATKTTISATDLELDGHMVAGQDYDTPAGWLYDIFGSGKSFESSKIVKEYPMIIENGNIINVTVDRVPWAADNTNRIQMDRPTLRRRKGGNLEFAGSGTDDAKFDDYICH